MQNFEENSLRNTAKTIDFDYYSDYLNEFIDNLYNISDEILNAMERNNINIHIKPFGSSISNGLCNEKENINIAIIFTDRQIYNETKEIGKTKLKNRRQKKSFLQNYQGLLYIMLQQFFAHKINIIYKSNSLILDSYKFCNCNFKLYVFTQSFEDDNLLTLDDEFLTTTFNIKKYEKNIATKTIATNGYYTKICNILKFYAIEYNICNDSLLIENFVYNFPNELFNGYLLEQLFNILNYYKCNGIKLLSIDCDKYLIANTFYNTSRNYKFIQTFDKIIDLFR